jgi:hypothetical protein
MSDNPDYADLLPHRATVDGSAVDPLRRIDWASVPAKKAVYLLVDSEGQPLLLATVGNLRAALQRRMVDDQPDAKTKRIHYGKITHKVHYRIVHSPFAANLWYYRAASQLFPERYNEMVSWRPAWWVSVDPAAEFPRFRRTQDLSDSRLQYAGPIPEKNAATKLIETLEDLFDLCRYYNILVQAPHGKACAYKEMGKCPAPCDGTVSMEHYRRQMGDALIFLRGDNRAWRQACEMEMHAAAAKLEFERASKIKSKLARGAVLDQPVYKISANLSDFCFLSLQPGKGRPWIEPIFIHGGNVETGEPVHKKNLATAAEGWFTRLGELCGKPVQPPLSRQDGEHIGLVVHHLMRGEDDAGIYLPMRGIKDAAAIVSAAQELIARRMPPKPMAEQSSEKTVESLPSGEPS